jgi:hypothetical protein
MFALVSGSPSAVRMASDQASSLLPVGVWFSAVGCGVSPELDGGGELSAGCGLCAGAEVYAGVGVYAGRGLDGDAVGVTVRRGVDLAVAFLEGECDASGSCAARPRGSVARAKLSGLAMDLITAMAPAPRGSVAVVAFVVLADSGICSAPAPTAIPTPSSAANPAAVTRRSDSAGRLSRALGRRWDVRGRPDAGRRPGERFKLNPLLHLPEVNDSAY